MQDLRKLASEIEALRELHRQYEEKEALVERLDDIAYQLAQFAPERGVLVNGRIYRAVLGYPPSPGKKRIRYLAVADPEFQVARLLHKRVPRFMLREDYPEATLEDFVAFARDLEQIVEAFRKEHERTLADLAEIEAALAALAKGTLTEDSGPG